MKSPEGDESKFPTFSGVLRAAIYALELVLVAASYFGFAESALWLPSLNPVATALWPPTGFALALVLLRGYRIWPAILIGSVASSAVTIRPIMESGAIGLGTLLAALAGAWLIGRWSNGRETFATPLGTATFVLVCFAPTAFISSTVAVGGLILTTDLNLANTVSTWLTWWLADAVATLIIAPVIVLSAMTPLRQFFRRGLLEAVAVCILTTAIGIVAYSPPVRGDLLGTTIDDLLPYRGPLGFLMFLPLMWVTLRGNRRNAATVALILCGFAAWSFSAGADPFFGSRFSFLLFCIATSVPALVLTAAIAARRAIEADLLRIQDQLNRQIERTNSTLENVKRHFQILIEGVVDHAIFVVDTAGRIASWNGTAQQIVGYAADEIIGKHFGIFYRPDERRAGEPNRALEMAVQSGKHEVEGWRIRKDGSLLFVTGTISSIRDDNGDLIGFANVIRDATERRDAQEKLVEAREQLATAQKMEAIGKLTGGIAHDFNNLLMIIGGNAQTFKRLLDPKLPRALEAIQTAAKRGESLTRQLLTFSRRQHLSPTVVDLCACIKSMRPMIESSLRGNIVYKEVIGATVWPVKVDIAELQLAIVNVAVNARDAMANGGTFTLSVENVTANDETRENCLNGAFVAIEFSDTGMGIPPDLLSKIFDPFFTTKEVGKGTGLGLSQVHGFAHQANGTVKVDSKVGQGTTITVYLPSSSDKEIANEEDPSTGARHSQRPMVLVVDDSAEVAEVTSSLFEHLGYNTVYRDSAEAALKLLADGKKVDLVFSDIVMPGTIDGVGLTKEIRSRYPTLPVILTTGYSDAAQAAPADLRILRKPFDSDALSVFIQDTVKADQTV